MTAKEWKAALADVSDDKEIILLVAGMNGKVHRFIAYEFEASPGLNVTSPEQRVQLIPSIT